MDEAGHKITDSLWCIAIDTFLKTGWKSDRVLARALIGVDAGALIGWVIDRDLSPNQQRRFEQRKHSRKSTQCRRLLKCHHLSIEGTLELRLLDHL